MQRLNDLANQLRIVIQANDEARSALDAITRKRDELKETIENEHHKHAQLAQQMQHQQMELAAAKQNIAGLQTTSGNKQHVQTANLLKTKEPTRFTNKINYRVWVEGLKADLVPIVP